MRYQCCPLHAENSNYIGFMFSSGCRKDFTAYANVCFREFGDRVLYWTTLNEPNIFVLAGYDVGISPPQRCSYPYGNDCPSGNSTVEPYIVAHNCLLAHASVATLYRKRYQVSSLDIFGKFILISNVLVSMFLSLLEQGGMGKSLNSSYPDGDLAIQAFLSCKL